MKILKALRTKLISLKHWFFKASLRKKIVVMLAVAILVFIVTSPLRSGDKQQFTTEKVSRDTVSDIVSESGNVVAAGRVDVFSTSTGIIQEIYAENGDAVTVGQNLFKVQSTATPEEKATAYANYLKAKTGVDSSNANAYSLRSAKDTAWDDFYSLATSSQYENDDGSPREDQRNSSAEFQSAQADWLAAEANYKNQQTVTAQAQASLSAASLAYQATQNAIVTATAAGTIGNLSAIKGDNVKAGNASGTPGSATVPPVLVIGDLSGLSISIEINEVDRPKVHSGQKATVKFTAVRDKTYEGTVTSVDNYGKDTDGVITYNVTLTINGLDSEVMPGMTSNVEIETEKHENVLAVPNSAIKAYQGGKAVQVLENNQPKFIPVKTGLKGQSKTEVTEGVTEGLQIITSVPRPPSSGGPFGGRQN